MFCSLDKCCPVEQMLVLYIPILLNCAKLAFFFLCEFSAPVGAEKNVPTWHIFWVFLLAKNNKYWLITLKCLIILCRFYVKYRSHFFPFFFSNVLYFHNRIQLYNIAVCTVLWRRNKNLNTVLKKSDAISYCSNKSFFK